MKERIAKIKTHFKENKKTYLACAGTAVTVAVGTILATRKDEAGDVDITNQAVGFLPRATYNSVTVHLEERSTPSKPVHLVGTDLYYSSLNDAARKTGHSITKLSRHVNGHVPSLDGDVFEVLNPA